MVDINQTENNAGFGETTSSPKRNGFSSLVVVLNVVLTLLEIWAVVHTIQTRSFDDIKTYSIYLAIPICVLVIISSISDWIEDHQKVNILEITILIFTSSLTIIGGFLGYSIIASLKDIYLWLLSTSINISYVILITISITFIIGFLLFFFRLKRRSVYGFTETIIGLYMAVNKVSEHKNIDLSFYATILTASVYLIVRGLDNIHQGIVKEPKDPFALKIFKAFLKLTNKSSSAV